MISRFLGLSSAVILTLLSISAAADEIWTYHQVLPGRARAFHRHGVAGIVFRIQGFSESVADTNYNPRLDRYNRYQSYGVVMPDNVLPLPGWDWSRWPGTTAIQLVPEALSAELRPPINGEAFVGGSHLDSRFGIFAMRFHDKAFDRSFWFNKSVFSFGGRIICLGSNIENHDYQHETVTTLFQTPLEKRTAPIRANSVKPIKRFSYAAEFGPDKAVWLMDPMGIGYVVPAGHTVRAARKTQLSVNDMGGREVSGDFASAWISHGKFPIGKGYEYTILLDTPPRKVAAYAKAPEHEVLAHGNNAHIVRHAESGVTGYALFRREPYIEEGRVRGVDRPCLVLTEEKGETLRISVCDPDLSPREEKASHGAHGEQASGNSIGIVLRGKWDFASGHPPENVRRTDLRPDYSAFAFDITPGQPTEILLKVRP